MSIQVVRKTFQVLEVLSRSTSPLTLATISLQVQMPKPTVCRILRTLLTLGYLTQEPGSNSYIPTGKLSKLGHNHQYHDLKKRAAAGMVVIFRKFNETVNLGVLDGTQVRYIHVIETTRPLRRVVEPEGSDSFYSTALGRAMVSHLPQMEQDDLVARVRLKKFTPYTIADKDALVKELALTRQRGWASETEENDLGVTCFGVPLIQDGRPAAAISISLPQSRLTTALRKSIIDSLLAIKLSDPVPTT
jgi:DNA-binding IclR family transcriptional regulator